MNKIKLTDSLQDSVVKLCQGNVGALNVLMQIIKDGKSIDPDSALENIGPLLHLDDLGIYGSNIWILYKERCEQNINKLIALLRANQLGFISDEKIRYLSEEHSFDFRHEDLTEIYNKVKERLPDFVLN